jgi:hypothetical protein
MRQCNPVQPPIGCTAAPVFGFLCKGLRGASRHLIANRGPKRAPGCSWSGAWCWDQLDPHTHAASALLPCFRAFAARQSPNEVDRDHRPSCAPAPAPGRSHVLRWTSHLLATCDLRGSIGRSCIRSTPGKTQPVEVEVEVACSPDLFSSKMRSTEKPVLELDN